MEETCKGESKTSQDKRKQLLLYAVELLSGQVNKRFVIGWLLDGKITGAHSYIGKLTRYIDFDLTIWYYDRQGILESLSLTLLENMPYFFALLFALQRFSDDDWGNLPMLSSAGCQPNKSGRHVEWDLHLPHVSRRGDVFASDDLQSEGDASTKVDCKTVTDPGKKFSTSVEEWNACEEDEATTLGDVRIRLQKDRRCPHGLAGRGSWLYNAKVEVAHNPSTRLVSKLATNPLVVKFAWVDVNRTSEYELIARARREAGPEYEMHLPELYCGRRYPQYNTANIRLALGDIPVPVKNPTDADEPSDGRRVLVVLVLRRLDGHLGDSNISNEKRLVQLKKCIDGSSVWIMRQLHSLIYCIAHYLIWKGGIHHRDISNGNLMYRTDENDGNKIYGVLNDWDLASRDVVGHPLARERTGTYPFMAIDLHTDLKVEQVLEHRYHHDLESFIWLAYWWLTGGEQGPSRGWLRADQGGQKGFFLASLGWAPSKIKCENPDRIPLQIVSRLLSRLRVTWFERQEEEAARASELDLPDLCASQQEDETVDAKEEDRLTYESFSAILRGGLLAYSPPTSAQ